MNVAKMLTIGESAAAAAAKSLQSCPTLCDPMDSSPPGSSIHRILQARIWSGLPFPSPSVNLSKKIYGSSQQLFSIH